MDAAQQAVATAVRTLLSTATESLNQERQAAEVAAAEARAAAQQAHAARAAAEHPAAAQLAAMQDVLNELRAGQGALRTELQVFRGEVQTELRTELRLFRSELMCCLRNTAVCHYAEAPISWPPHDGTTIATESSAVRRPRTRGELNAAAITLVDALLAAYGLPNGPNSGTSEDRRLALMAHIGIVP